MCLYRNTIAKIYLLSKTQNKPVVKILWKYKLLTLQKTNDGALEIINQTSSVRRIVFVIAEYTMLNKNRRCQFVDFICDNE